MTLCSSDACSDRLLVVYMVQRNCPKPSKDITDYTVKTSGIMPGVEISQWDWGEG